MIESNPLLYIALAWTLAWKGVALWKSARNNHIYWFVAFLILNTLGALPIIYLLWLMSRQRKAVASAPPVRAAPTRKKATRARKKVSRKKK